jgi:hypothetical protein
MWIIIAIIVLWFVLIKPLTKFIASNKRNNTQAYFMLNDETKMLIQNEDVLELAWLITECEKAGDYRTGNVSSPKSRPLVVREKSLT